MTRRAVLREPALLAALAREAVSVTGSLMTGVPLMAAIPALHAAGVRSFPLLRPTCGPASSSPRWSPPASRTAAHEPVA